MNSFSQGIFVFKNGVHGKAEKRRKTKYSIPQTTFDCDDDAQLWNEEFERTWGFVKSKVDEIQANNNDGHMAELCAFVQEASVLNVKNVNDASNMTLLRVAAILTGINKPDHYQYFKLLSNTMSKNKIARTVFLPARDCPNVRTAIETLVSCIISNGRKHNYRDEADVIANNDASFKIGSDDSEISDNDVQMNEDEPPIKLRRNQYTLDVLQSWYDAKFSTEWNGTRAPLAIIMPNFEEFKPTVIKDLIMILSKRCHRLPFVLILGVATSTTTLLNTLSFIETTQIKLREFSGQPPNQILDQIFDDVILTPKCPFQLSSNVLEYLKNVFIFYDLTSKNCLRSTHYCLLDQYSRGNAYAVCSTSFEQAKRNIALLKSCDFETIRRLPSFRPYVEAMLEAKKPQKVLDIMQNDEFLRKELIVLVQDIYVYFARFYGYIRFLWNLVKDLPKAPMGKRLSDIYTFCQASQKSVTKTEEFEKCWQLLGMMSKDEFINLLDECYKSLETYDSNYSDSTNDDEILKKTQAAFDETYEKILEFKLELKQDRQSVEKQTKPTPSPAFQSRTLFNQYLLQKQKESKAEINTIMCNILEVIRVDVIEKYLPVQKQAPPLLELFVYSDYDKLKSHLRGTSRTAIHKALTDPHCYLQCKCCGLENSTQLKPTMPDNSIAYGLLLESGQQVNIYDWMSAFNSIVGNRNADDDDERDIPPEIQAKFTRARAELHFMGYTKNSKRKTDHVTRTTW